MKKIFSSRRRHYVARVCIFLITLALVVEMVGCSCGGGGGGGGGVNYDLTISSTAGGSVTPGVGKHTYAAGKSVNLVASPTSGYRFDNWTGNAAAMAAIGDVNAASTSITMNGRYSITANFKAVYDLTISSTDGGSVTPGVGKHTYDDKTKVTLVAEAEEGYRFVNWTGNAAAVAAIADDTAAKTTITMSGSYNITANFEEIQYTLTIWVNDWEAGWVITPGVDTFTYAAGTTVDLWAVATAEWSIFWCWAGDTDYIADVYDPTTTITMLGDYKIIAVFYWIFEY